jgi:broad specificity phosphatase PhoE
MSIRSGREMHFELIRHAEADKNRKHISGGGGQDLSPLGELQAEEIGGAVARTMAAGAAVLVAHQPELRCANTVGRVAACSQVNTQEIPLLQGVGLGPLAALTEKALEETYPEVARAHATWRAGSPLSSPYIPGMEPMSAFAARVRRGLLDVIAGTAANHVFFIATTSTLNMLTHLLENDGVFDRDGYHFADFDLARGRAWLISASERPREVVPKHQP